ncbi:hypothetical protein [Geomonas sp.]|uniref:hypothetical protein n=1 Tax=Geomonas sp. TaxID=2651584 RepID=UPI002B49DE1A|nr:hypothetical protein [Geomonas sp.]HJV36193.1 hypothetical protein [Geomonas sp.]
MDEQLAGDASGKVIIETLELIIIVLGIIFIGYLGWMVLMPMAVGLFFYFPCAFLIDMVMRARNASKQ